MSNSLFPGEIPIVKVDNLTIYRGEYAAVESVSFQLLSGTNTAIVGPNGAGKSTLIQAILGLIEHQAGVMQIFGHQIEKLGQLWHRIGYIPQKWPFDRSFPLSVAELVGLGYHHQSGFLGFGKYAKRKREAVEYALEQVNLQNRTHQRIGVLSGGELKRVLLAYCLVVPRRLLVLDEAMAGVDATGEAEFAELLAKLQREQAWTILQVSHDLDMVSSYCDRVLCMNRSLLCQGVPSNTLSSENINRIYGSTLTRYFHQHESLRVGKSI
ncbi:MAG: metal ABC transporter ATP-binding protein [Hormoscilla sp.]